MRTLRRAMALTGVLLLTLLATGCGTITNSAIGTWAGEQGTTKLEFTNEGVVTGQDGCVRVTGDWHQKADTVIFYGLAPAEQAVNDGQVWLKDPATATVSNGTMTFYDSDHEQIGELTRQD